MLNTIRLTDRECIGSAMLLGGFDGLHVGHRHLLSRAKESGLPVGIMTIVGGKEQNLFTFQEREKIFQKAGADFVFELPFAEIKDLSPQAFLSLIEKQFSPKLYVCGDDFRFGKNAVGTPEFLKSNTRVCVDVQKLLTIDEKKISSNTVKTLLKNGDIPTANALLGERFFLMGEVIQDRKIGRTLGFPTANIFYPQGKVPLKKGVYQTLTVLNGTPYHGVTNFGARPTFNDSTIVTETYLDGFSGDLYGQTLTVEFVRYLREIEKFDDTTALKTQLEKDVRRMREHD